MNSAKLCKILVVDDEPDVCWVLRFLLQKHGFNVVSEESGLKALEWLKSSANACRLILVDAKLSDIEGVDLARRIRGETSCKAPILLVSGYFYKDDSLVQESLRSSLISGFVTKPFRHDEILSAIESILTMDKK